MSFLFGIVLGVGLALMWFYSHELIDVASNLVAKWRAK